MLISDLRYSLRSLARSPGFTLAVVPTLVPARRAHGFPCGSPSAPSSASPRTIPPP